MIKNCVICNAEFEAQRADAEVCSAACRQKNWRKKQEQQSAAPSIAPLPEEPAKTKLVVESAGLRERPSDFVTEKMKKVMDGIKKDFGEGAIMFLGDKPMDGIEAISTGSMGLDQALGIGGLPKGRMVEIYGPEASGKTTLTLHLIAEAQKAGIKCYFIDAEHAFDPDYAENLGIDLLKLTISQPDYGEQALEMADRATTSGEYGVIIIDSVAALTPKAEIEGEMGDSKMGLQARMMSQACRKLAACVSKSGAILVFINQLRDKIGIVYGSPETTPGGNALKFFSSIRIDVRRLAILKDGEEAYGNRVKAKVVKNKVAPPFKFAEFDIIYGEGINKMGEIIDTAVEKNIIKKSGSWYSYGDQKLGQGRESVIEMMKANPEFAKEIEQKLKTL